MSPGFQATVLPWPRVGLVPDRCTEAPTRPPGSRTALGLHVSRRVCARSLPRVPTAFPEESPFCKEKRGVVLGTGIY